MNQLFSKQALATCSKLALAGAVIAASQTAMAQMYGPAPGFYPPMIGPRGPLMAPGTVLMPPPMLMPPPPPLYMPPPVFVPPGSVPGITGQVAGIAGVNREGQIAAECAAQYGPSKVAAACIASRLTVAEVAKCFNDGFGGRGCFGDSNTIVQTLRANFEAAQRERDPASAWVRLSSGISVTAIRDNGILGGDNSDARKACDSVAGLFGGRC